MQQGQGSKAYGEKQTLVKTMRETKKVATSELLKYGDGDGPLQSKKVDVSSTFIENIFRSGLTLVVSSNDIITIKIGKKNNC